VPPSQPSWAAVGFPASGLALRWAPNAEPTLRGYRLYRTYDASAADDVRSMTPLFAAAEAEGAGAVHGIVVERDDTGAVTAVTELPADTRPPGRLAQYVDLTAEKGRTVYYRLVAEDEAGHRSAPSALLTVQLPKRSPPTPPVWNAPTIAGGQVTLSWTADEDDLSSLLMRRTGGTIWRPLGPWAPEGDYGFTDSSVEAGASYEYRVRVRDRAGHVVDGPTLSVVAS
jgi:hypothetical protein